MMFYIESRKLWSSNWENIIRLANFLGINNLVNNCDCTNCKLNLINNVHKKINEVY
jgi:hypothetical protein